MLKIENLTYRIGARTLIERASATIHPGHKVGLVGRNGTGKTTLLGLITGAREAQDGDITVPSRWRVGETAQEAPSGDASLIDTVISADRELAGLTAEAETADDPARIAEIQLRLADIGAHTARARAAKLLAGLGFSEEEQHRACSTFSGGWRMRVALASLLFTEPDLLLLDEPTNHLDLEATLWLEGYLKHYPGTVLLVSHDRDLLNRAVDEILHLHDGKLTLYAGGYDRFEKTRRMRLEQDAKQRARQSAERERIQAFVDRFRYKATKARQAQSRLKMLARMEPIAETREEATFTFEFPDPEPLSSPLIALDDVSVGYDGDPVLSRLDLRLDTDDRIALLGANGNGKSTLIKLLAGQLEKQAGEISKSRKLQIGYFAQHQADELDLAATPLIELQRRRPRETEERLRAQLGRFGFIQERAETKVLNLSGGEKARLLFALMTVNRPHILLLDEPTNHLDVDARQALVQAINAYDGAVILVSHDPHLINLTADRFWLVRDGQVTRFDGDMDDYRSRIGGRDTDSPVSADAKPQDAQTRKSQRQEAAARRQAIAPLRKKVAEAEAAIGRLEADKARLTDEMADPALYGGDNSSTLVEKQKALADVARDLLAAEERWLTLQAELEAAESEQN